MQRQSWNAKRIERLKAELKKAGNTPEAFNTMADFYELLPLEAQELSEQVRWPNPPKVISDPYLTGIAAKSEGKDPVAAIEQAEAKAAAPQVMVVKRFTPPTPPPKLVIKRY